MALVLNETDVRSLVSMDELVDATAEALAAFSAGGVVQPLRTVLEAGGPGRFFGVMPAFLPAGALGAKLVTVFPDNLPRDLPSHRAVIVLIDPESGELAAIVDGRYLTEARTAAHIVGELGEVVAGRLSGRTSPDEITIFKSLGMAVEDVAAAALVYRRACERGLGRGVAI